MKRTYEKDKTDQINILLSKKLKIKFKIFCVKNEFLISDRIRLLIEKDAENKIEIKP